MFGSFRVIAVLMVVCLGVLSAASNTAPPSPKHAPTEQSMRILMEQAEISVPSTTLAKTTTASSKIEVVATTGFKIGMIARVGNAPAGERKTVKSIPKAVKAPFEIEFESIVKTTYLVGQPVTVLRETRLTAATAKDAKKLTVLFIEGFSVGDTIQIGTGEEAERTTVTGFSSPTIMECTALAKLHGTGDPVVFVAKTSEAPSCFPGSATAIVAGRGPVPLSSLKVGDSVLVVTAGVQKFQYQPVTSFLHAVRSPATQSQEVRAIVHSHGTLRATNGHLVFVERQTSSGTGAGTAVPAADIRPGDRIFVAGINGTVTTAPELCTVIRVQREFTNTGMFGPFTPAGSIVIDGVVASNYATPSLDLWLPHGAAHAMFFFLRALHAVGLSTVTELLSWNMDARQVVAEETHPFVGIIFNTLRFDKLMVQR